MVLLNDIKAQTSQKVACSMNGSATHEAQRTCVWMSCTDPPYGNIHTIRYLHLLQVLNCLLRLSKCTTFTHTKLITSSHQLLVRPTHKTKSDFRSRVSNNTTSSVKEIENLMWRSWQKKIYLFRRMRDFVKVSMIAFLLDPLPRLASLRISSSPRSVSPTLVHKVTWIK